MHLSPLLSQIPVNWGKGKGKKKKEPWPNKDRERDEGKTGKQTFRKEKEDRQVVAHLADLGKLPWGGEEAGKKAVWSWGTPIRGCLELGDTQFCHKIKKDQKLEASSSGGRNAGCT